MGAQGSIPYRRISRVIPQLHEPGWTCDKSSNYHEKERDRDQLIHAILALLSDNGRVSLEEHEFKLLYSRRKENEERVVATVVAMKEGRIEAKIEPAVDGANATEAFRALKKHIEMNLHGLLESVPDVAPPSGGESVGMGLESARSSLATLRTTVTLQSDAPPTYSEAGDVNAERGGEVGKRVL